MLVKEKVDLISGIIEDLFLFVQKDESVVNDFREYLGMFQQNTLTPSNINSILVPYVFERRLGKDRKTIAELYKESQKDLDDQQKAILDGLNQNIYSIFEIKKILKNGFQLYNLINELNFSALALTKMTQYRGISVGQYMIARIFPFEGEYYLIEISEIIPSYDKEKAYRYAVAKQMNEPELLYKGNSEKLAEIENLVSSIGKKFKEFFKTDEVITTNKKVDELISCFNDYLDEEITCDKEKLASLIETPDKYAYFEVKELTSHSGDFLEAASRGFSSHEKKYDVGIVYDFDAGMLVIPFLATFKHIFEAEDYKTVQGYKECISNYLQSPKIPPSILQKVYKLNPEKFIKIVNEVMEKDFKDINEIIHEYKINYEKTKQFSSTTVLYSSYAFQQLMNYVGQEDNINVQKVGRNDPCPCGSGKKYKKCCLLK